MLSKWSQFNSRRRHRCCRGFCALFDICRAVVGPQTQIPKKVQHERGLNFVSFKIFLDYDTNSH